MATKPPLRRRAGRTCLAAVAALALPACSIQIREPAADSVVSLPSTASKTKVVVTGSQSYTGLTVTVDGTDVSSQMIYQGSNRDEGQLSLAPGRHTLVASADVYCWYCTGQKNRSTDRKTFCVAISGAAGGLSTRTTFARGDGKSWSSSGGASLSYASDAGTSATRWRFTNLGGAGNIIGVIESAEFPCKCLRSPDGNNNSTIALSLCDTTDVRQQWRGLRQVVPGATTAFYTFENVSPDTTSWGCLTEAPGGTQVVQSACNNTASQLWSIRRNPENTFESETNPWTQ